MKTGVVYFTSMTVIVTLFICLVPTYSAYRSRNKKHFHRKAPCDFRWSSWSNFSPCSRSCGLGIKSRNRTCYQYGPDPRPVNGKHCKGKTRDHQACNTQSCSVGSRDFRELQCSFMLSQLKAQAYYWKLFSRGSTSSRDPCVLHCDKDLYADLVVRSIDGTRCASIPPSVCVTGTCVPIGCDQQPYSNKSVDRCGVCGGSNNTCHTVSRTVAHRVPAGYTDFLQIPLGARYLKITERPGSDVILTLKNTKGTSSVTVHRSRDHVTETKLMAGTVVYYYTSNEGQANIRAEGPLTENIVVMGYTRKSGAVSLSYEYSITSVEPKTNYSVKRQNKSEPEPSFPWQSQLYEQLTTITGLRSPARTQEVTSTVLPSCIRREHSRRRLAGRSHSVTHVQPFGILNRKSGHRNSGRRRHYHSRRKQTGRIAPSNKKSKSRGYASVINKFKMQAVQNTSIEISKNVSGSPHKTHLNISSNTQIESTARKQTPTLVEQKHTDGNVTMNSRTQLTPKYNSSGSPRGNKKQGFERRFILNVRTTPVPTGSSAFTYLANISSRHPIEDPIPTYMPDTTTARSNGRLSVYRGGLDRDDDDDDDDEEDDIGAVEQAEFENLQVDVSVQVAAKNALKAERRRRGRDRGRRRKKEDKGNKQRFKWQANSVSPCTATCQLGTKVTLFSCYHHSGEKVPDKFCKAEEKPVPTHHVCASKTCRPRWEAGLWSECSASCGEGRQTRTVRCWQMMAPGFDSTVRDFTCDPADKPQSVRSCHKLRSCVPQWEMSSWEECSMECGYGVQLRHIRCSGETPDACNARQRPPDKRPCRNKPCVNQWFTLPWSSCSGMCGIRKRRVYCRDAHGRVVDDRKCDYNSKPLSAHACGRCKNKWVPQEWGECSVTCGVGVTTRRVVCGTTRGGSFHIRPDSFCVKEVRAPTTTSCRSAPCGATWYSTEWTECSESCGTAGLRYREVRCHGGTASELCDPKTRPEEKTKCDLAPCETRTTCEDNEETRCDLVASAKLCSHNYYRKACCKTCSQLN